MILKFNKNQVVYDGPYYNLGLSLLQEGFDKTVNGEVEFKVDDNSRFTAKEIVSLVNNNVVVESFPTYIYADAAILSEDVYPELPNSTIVDEDDNVTAVKFSDWNNGGTQPVFTSVDGTKIILRTNVSGHDLDGKTVKLLSARPNIEVLGHKELQNKLNSEEFTSAANIKELTVTEINDRWIADFNDFKQAREKMKEIVSETGFQNLTHSEKKIAAKWFAVPISDIDSVLTFSEKLEASVVFNTQSIKSREKRLGACMLLGRNVLSFEDGNIILDDILEYGFINSYVTIGREGSEQMNVEGVADPDGIIDYLKAKEGTIYEHTGLLTKNIVPINGMTLQQLSDTFVDILLNGNY